MSSLGDSDYYEEHCLFVQWIIKIFVNPWIFLSNIPWYLGFGNIWTPYR